MTETAKKTVAKKTTARTPKVTGAEAGSGPEKRTVITTEGTREVSEVAELGDAKAEAKSDLDAKRFGDLETSELRAIAEFFVKDVDPLAGRTEVLAALVSEGEDGDEPVTWDDYINSYLPAQPSKAADVPQKEAGNPLATEDDDEDDNEVLVFMERKNPRYDIAGYTFTTEHPFNAVPEKTAAYLVKHGGFRVALPSEVQDYYN